MESDSSTETEDNPEIPDIRMDLVITKCRPFLSSATDEPNLITHLKN